MSRLRQSTIMRIRRRPGLAYPQVFLKGMRCIDTNESSSYARRIQDSVGIGRPAVRAIRIVFSACAVIVK
jgi:hypothetical protein